MECKKVQELLEREKLIVLFRRVPLDKLGDTARSLVRGGIKILEVTFDQDAEDPNDLFKESVEKIKEAVGDALCLGAGTVLNETQVRTAYEAGAEFIVSPNTKKTVIELTKALGMFSAPGAMTPTEIVTAWDYGADMVKLFPADDLGYHYIWNIRGPLSHIPLMATGGVNPETIPKFLEQGISCVGTGVSVVNRDMLNAGDFDGIEKLARAHVEAVAQFRRQ